MMRQEPSKGVDELVVGLCTLQGHLNFQKRNSRYRQTAEPFYLEHLEALKRKRPELYSEFKTWYDEYCKKYPLSDIGPVRWGLWDAD